MQSRKRREAPTRPSRATRRRLAQSAISLLLAGPLLACQNDLADYAIVPRDKNPTLIEGGEGSNDAEVSGVCIDGSVERCSTESDIGECRSDERTCQQGEWSECAGGQLPGTRDCASERDKDCDGRPDDTLDDQCRCQVGSVQPCDEHPGFDGLGPCRAGQQQCVRGSDSATSDWGPCRGAVAPEPSDDCDAPGDDSDCDGIPLSPPCICEAQPTQACGPSTDVGACQFGVSTCNDDEFGPCVGAVFAAPRDCRSSGDNDCDGQPDNALVGVACNASGSRGACANGRFQCSGGALTCAPAPSQSEACDGIDNDCDGRVDEACIDVLFARIGCLDIQIDGNLTGVVSTACDGRTACSYKAPTPQQYESLGVQAATRPFCTQAMQIDYQCGPLGTRATVTVPGDAWNQPPAELGCFE